MSDRKYPEKLMLRDTGQYDDLGGAGQRIFTTAGQGYDKIAYIRWDIVSIKNRKLAEQDKRIEELEKEVEEWKGKFEWAADKLNKVANGIDTGWIDNQQESE